MKYNEVIFLAHNEKKLTGGDLLYIIPKKEYVICTDFQRNGEEIEWNWGHYYNDFKNAIIDFYKEDLNNDFNLAYNYDILTDLQYSNNLTDIDIKAIQDILKLIMYINKDKEI